MGFSPLGFFLMAHNNSELIYDAAIASTGISVPFTCVAAEISKKPSAGGATTG
jgi:hypothetical protein